MKKHTFFALFLAVNFACTAQIKFENGYFITNGGQKKFCLIRNIDWLYNPTSFSYKDSANGQVQKADMEHVSEFGILNYSRYKRYAVNIDTSGGSIDQINSNSLPEFKQEIFFLKVLVDGKASLYLYNSRGMTRFFFTIDDSLKPEQLIFKSYYASQNLIAENNTFRDQLLNNLLCPSINQHEVERVGYEKKDLEKLFEQYNNCQQSTSTSFEGKHEAVYFNLNFKPAINISSLSLFDHSNGPNTTAFGSKLSFSAGLEAELVLPFNKNSWSVILEPSFQSYRSSYPANNSSINYRTIELSAGIKHFFFLTPNTKLFLTGSLFYAFPVNSTFVYESADLSLVSRIDARISAGYMYKSRYGIELKYELPRNILDYYEFIISHYNTTSIVLTFKLF
jgi:hypothetical protein